MKIDHPIKGVIHFIYDTQYELTSSFMRMQEFYESPYPEIKDKYFTIDGFLNVYTMYGKNGKFRYFEDWSGFNIPGNVVLRFFWKYLFHFRTKERAIFKGLSLKQLLGLEKFYIIGTVIGQEKVIQHETAHALYYLKPKYKEEMDFLINELDDEKREQWNTWLLNRQYCKEVLDDEIQAYSVERGVKSFKKVFDYYVKK